MTLAQIFRLALRQLDEDPEDISEFRDLFMQYANMGYEIAWRDFLKPRSTLTFYADAETGRFNITGTCIYRIIEGYNEDSWPTQVQLLPDGQTVQVVDRREWGNSIRLLCDMVLPPLEEDTDEPQLPVNSQMGIVDYICYRYLSTGNMAKQSRAQYFLQQAMTAFQGMRPKQQGSVTDFKNFYSATDVRHWR